MDSKVMDRFTPDTKLRTAFFLYDELIHDTPKEATDKVCKAHERHDICRDSYL
jgi:hypothetical protein